MYGGYPGGQAEYARVPFADIGPLKVPDSLTDEQVLFRSDILPHRLHGGRQLPDQTGRHDRGVGLRARPSVRHQEPIFSGPSGSSRSIASPNASSWPPCKAALRR
jgi:hypothetical protein